MSNEINKSQIARDFWRKIFDDNSHDLTNFDLRNKLVIEFFKENKEWNQNKDKRFFRIGFDKVCRERGFNPHDFNMKPIRKISKTQKGSMNISISTDEKKINKESTQQTQIPNQNINQNMQQQQAVNFSMDSISVIFETMFNFMAARNSAWTKLTLEEKTALCQAWQPVFEKYFHTENIWITPLIITMPIMLSRFYAISQAKKEDEMKQEIKKEIKEEKPKEDPTKNANWLKEVEKDGFI